MSLHLAPHAPWLVLAVVSAALLLLARWAYRFGAPPLPAAARRLLPVLRVVGLLLLLWLLAQPVLERGVTGGVHIVALVDHSLSMRLPAAPEGPSRAAVADRAAADLARAWRGRAAVDVIPFAARLGPAADSAGGRSATALGDALTELARGPEGQRAEGVVVISDGAVNAGADPVAAARALGVPVHAVVVGDAAGTDRAIAGIDASVTARVGQVSLVRVRYVSTEPRGTPFGLRLMDGARELGRATATAPGGGAEGVAEFRVTPAHPGLAVWTAVADSLAGEISTVNNARGVAVQVAPGRLGVLVLSAGLNWDLAFLRRSLASDSSVAVATWVREGGSWRELGAVESTPLGTATLRGQAVVVLDALSTADLGPGLDEAVAAFVRDGGGLLAFGGPAPGLARLRSGRLGPELAVTSDPRLGGRPAAPLPSPESRDLLQWDDDAVRGDQAWRAAAPLSDVLPLIAGPGDRALLGSQGGGPALFLARRIGRGQALLVNGTGLWRWSLSSLDELSGERCRQLWQHLVHWLAQPVQGEPLRVQPERWLVAGGEPVRLFASLQDDAFRPVAGAAVEGEVRGGPGAPRHVRFEPREPGSYVATLDDLPPGRYQVTARAQHAGRDAGHATSEFAVDRWSLEEARTLPDSAALAAIAAATGGSVSPARDAATWAHGLSTRALARERVESARLWEWPWLFAVVVGALSIEWAWRRRRGLP